MGCELRKSTSPESGDFQHITGNRLLERKSASWLRQISVSSCCCIDDPDCGDPEDVRGKLVGGGGDEWPPEPLARKEDGMMNLSG